MEFYLHPAIIALLVLNIITFIGLIQESKKRKRDIFNAQKEILEIINKRKN